MSGVTKTLKEVQQHLQQLIPADTILLGHSLENDLKALKVFYSSFRESHEWLQLVHSKVIDTSILYPHMRGDGYKSALRFLSQKFLSRTIQSEEHNSIQDCIACMELVQLKLKHGTSMQTSSSSALLNVQRSKFWRIDFRRYRKSICVLRQKRKKQCSCGQSESIGEICGWFCLCLSLHFR